MLKSLVLQHIAFERLGRLGHVLQRALWRVDTRKAPCGDALPASMDGYDGLIILGGDMSVNDPLPWVNQEIALIQGARKRKIPVLGICLGAQLIAKAFGGKVEKNPSGPEIGWAPITFLPEAKNDAILKQLPGMISMFHWHGETWSLPAGAALLASSEKCAQQIFRLDETIYGFQCHPEVGQEDIVNWIQGYREEMDFQPDTVESIRNSLARWGEFYAPTQRILEDFVKLMTARTPKTLSTQAAVAEVAKKEAEATAVAAVAKPA